jgi:hypothetical protein
MLTFTKLQADIGYIVNPTDEIYQYLPELKEMTFPNIQIWRVSGDAKLFTSLDISGANLIDFSSGHRFMNRLFPPIPISTQLMELELSQVNFTPESLTGGQRYSLPCLTFLTLCDVKFLGPLQNYFHFPKLYQLEYKIRYFRFIRDPNKALAPIQEVLDETFCQEAATIEAILFDGVTMSAAFVRNLASFPILRNLELYNCLIGEFIHPFLEKLQEPKCFPSLVRLCIDHSWVHQPDLSYNDFVAQIKSRRPRITISGDGRCITDPY